MNSASPSLPARPPIVNLNSRLLLFAASLVLLASLLPTLLIFNQLDKQLMEKAQQELAAESNLQLLLFRSQISNLSQDVTFLAGTPPIRGIIRSRNPQNMDPLDGSNLTLWNTRLRTIFSKLSQTRSSYLGISYFRLAEKPEELVSSGSSTWTAPTPEGTCAKEVLLKAMAMERPLPGTVRFSDVYYRNITPNSAPTPIVLAATPVYDRQGRFFGAVVIQMNLAPVIRSIANQAAADHSTWVHHNGKLLFVSKDTPFGLPLELFKSIELEASTPWRGLNSPIEEREGYLLFQAPAGPVLGYSQRFPLDPSGQEVALNVVLLQDLDHIYAVSTKVKGQLVTLLAGLLLMTLAAAYWESRRLTKPITNIAKSISQYALGEPLLLPSNYSGEAGELARAFTEMAVRVEHQAAEIRSEIQARQKTQQKLQAVFQAANDAILVLSTEGTITKVNPRTESMFGIARDYILGQHLTMLFHPDCRARIESIVADREQNQNNLELVALDENHAELPVEVSIGRSETDDTLRLVAIIRDIRERKLAEIQLLKANEALARSNSELEQFTRIASHDLQAPLRSIVSFSQILQAELRDVLTDEQREYMQYLMDGGRRMSRLLRDVREYSKLDGSQAPMAPVELDDVLAEVLQDLRSSLQDSGTSVKSDSLPRVIGVRTQLRQLLQNLIDNAISYRDRERPNQVTVSARREGSFWEIQVKDTGLGIHPENHKKIFDLFERICPGEESTGIGLAIAQRTVERHHGRIWVESEPGLGSVFKFTLPALPNQDLSASKPNV